MKTWEAWGDPIHGANCFIPAPITDEAKAGWNITKKISEEMASDYKEEFIHLFSIISDDYIDAMTEYYRAQGWGIYKPDDWELKQNRIKKTRRNK